MENKMSVTMLYINMIYNTEVKYVAMILAVISYWSSISLLYQYGMYHWSLGGSKKLPISHLQIMGFFRQILKGTVHLKHVWLMSNLLIIDKKEI